MPKPVIINGTKHKLACWIHTQAHWCNCPYGQWYANGGDKPQLPRQLPRD